MDVVADCDNDTLLVTARPRGPACHNGTLTCFGDEPRSAAGEIAFLAKLEGVIAQRATEKPEASYTARLLDKGMARVAQKVGEEGVELALAGVGETDDKVVEESADLLFHLLVLLRARGVTLAQVVQKLESRRTAKHAARCRVAVSAPEPSTSAEFFRRRAQVVVRRHRAPVGARRRDQQHVARLAFRQQPVVTEEIRALADRARRRWSTHSRARRSG